MSKALENMNDEELRKMVAQLESERTKLEHEKYSLEHEKSRLESEKSSLQAKMQTMQFQIDQMNRLLYGSKRERFIKDKDENQMELPFDVEPEKEPEKQEETRTYVRKKAKRASHPGRMVLPSHLPVVETILEPEEDTTGMKCIGKEVTAQLELVPAKLYIKRHIRPKYIKSTNEETLEHKGVIAPLPVFPIEKGLAGPGLLSQIMVDKFVDHLPTYRQIEHFKREGIKISSSTINGWQESICNLLLPLYENLKRHALQQGYLQIDETPVKVLDKSKKGKTHLNCMAHARREFEKALDYDRINAEHALGMFQKLYAIERVARDKGFSSKERYQLRLDESLPVLNELSKWIIEKYKEALPKSPLGKALAYCIPRWEKLTNYLHDGELEIDNNLAENAIRPITLGRKNDLFAGSERGAQRAAMFYSFFGTCKKNNVNPFEWLKKVLEVIPQHKVNKLDELLPQNLKL